MISRQMVSGAAADGNRVKTLTALRSRLAAEVDECVSMRDLVALSRALMDVLLQLEEAGRAGAAEQKGTTLDELKKRRSRRAASA